jgi:hypothetical protein
MPRSVVGEARFNFLRLEVKGLLCDQGKGKVAELLTRATVRKKLGVLTYEDEQQVDRKERPLWLTRDVALAAHNQQGESFVHPNAALPAPVPEGDPVDVRPWSSRSMDRGFDRFFSDKRTDPETRERAGLSIDGPRPERKRIDTCRTCHTWDTTHAREIARSVTELKEMLLDIFPDYFAEFNAGTFFMWSTAVDMGVESVIYLESLAFFISQHKKQMSSRAHLDAEKKQVALEMTEATALGKLLGEDGVINVVSLYAQHWQLRDFVKGWLAQVQIVPTPKRTFFWFDFADLFFSF